MSNFSNYFDYKDIFFYISFTLILFYVSSKNLCDYYVSNCEFQKFLFFCNFFQDFTRILQNSLIYTKKKIKLYLTNSDCILFTSKQFKVIHKICQEQKRKHLNFYHYFSYIFDLWIKNVVDIQHTKNINIKNIFQFACYTII